MAYSWLNSELVGKHEEAIKVLKAGIEANPARYDSSFDCVPFSFSP